VIVRPDRLAFSAQLVPVDLIAEASDQGIRLRWTIRRSLVTKATNGPVGHLESFVVDPVNDQIKHVVVRTGHLLSRQRVAVPASEMATIVDHAILLRLDRRGVEELPHVPLHEISPLPRLNPADRDLVAEHPRAAGLADPDVDASHLEGAHLLADEAADRLRAAGLTEDQILSWAKAFLWARHAGDIDEFITWIHEREHLAT
jgi:hypothetical protein